MSFRRLLTVLTTLLTLALVAAALVVLWPVQLGGRTAYVVTTGTSMEPGIEAGDLVLTRSRGRYEVGDVVLYRSTTLGRDVLHRIVGRDGRRFVLEGDNNGYRDAERPTADRIVGAQWLHVPAVGAAVQWLRRPLLVAALVLVAAFGLLVGGRASTRGVTAPRAEAGPGGATSWAAASTIGIGAAGALCLFLVVGAAAWTRPESRRATVHDAWAHTGRFAYGATVPRSPVYPAGRVESGDPVFTRLVQSLDVAFTYRFASTRRTDVRGTAALDATVSDGQGWSRRVRLAGEVPFGGGSVRLAGRLDVRRLQGLVERMRGLTGSTASSFTVTLAPTIEVVGYVGPTVLDDRFTPTLALALDETGLRPAPSSSGEPPSFAARTPGVITVAAPGALRAGPASIGVSRARSLSVLGAAVATVVALVALALTARRRPDPSERARAVLGRRLVEADAVVPDGRWVTDVAGAEELARIADHYDRVVLHGRPNGVDVFLVDDGVTVYRYAIGGDAVVHPQAVAVAAP
jgi:signal peptidase I